MSTRCNIKITGPTSPSTLYLYRHHDGYLSETGRHVAQIIRHPLDKWSRSVPMVAARFLQCCYDKTSYQKAKPIYELTDAAHGDIEFFYHIDVNADGCLRIGYANGYGPKLEQETALGDLATFVDAVNREIASANHRIRAHNKTKNADHQYDEIEPLPTQEGCTSCN